MRRSLLVCLCAVLKSDKYGLGLAVIRKHLLPARDAGRAAGGVGPQPPDVGPLLAQAARTPSA